MSTRERHDSLDPARWVRFQVAGGHYGIEVGQVRDVRDVPALEAPAGAPACVLGSLLAYGEQIRVIDARRLFHGGPRTHGPRARVLIIDGGDGPVGLLVDSIEDVRAIATVDILRPVAANDPAYVRGICRSEEETILLDGGELARVPAAAAGF